MSGQRWALVVGALPTAVMLFAAGRDIVGGAELAKAFESLRVDPAWPPRLGWMILVFLALHWMPRTALFGTILLTAYLGGAVAFNLLLMNFPPVAPVLLACLFWVSYMLRHPEVMAAAGLRRLGAN